MSRLYGRFSCAKEQRTSRYVVLDIEVALERESRHSESSRKGMDRVDLVLYDTEACEIRFFEAKHFLNSEIRAKEDAPKVVRQIEDYRKQLEDKHDEILMAYKSHIGVINELFALKPKLPDPVKLDKEPRLLVFGFDDDQKGARLKRDLAKLEENGISVYSVGKIESAKIENVFKGGRSAW